MYRIRAQQDIVRNEEEFLLMKESLLTKMLKVILNYIIKLLNRNKNIKLDYRLIIKNIQYH